MQEEELQVAYTARISLLQREGMSVLSDENVRAAAEFICQLLLGSALSSCKGDPAPHRDTFCFPRYLALISEPNKIRHRGGSLIAVTRGELLRDMWQSRASL